MSTAFPGSLDTTTTLYDAVNNATSTLSGSHTAGGTTIDLTSAALFPSTGGIIYVGNERTTYTGKSTNQLTGMVALSNNYPAGTAVAMYVDAEHHNVLRGAVVAIETAMGATGSVVAGTVVKRLTDLEAASTTVAAQIHAASAKSTPEDTDEIGITDNAGSWALKKTTWAQVKAALKTYFDSVSTTLTNKTLTAPVISTISNTGTVTLPTATDTLVARATTDTLTNKRVTARVGSTTSSATPTINTDSYDIYKLTAQTVDITSFTTNLSGTPTDGQVLIIQITGTAARAITWGASFEASTVALPTTTVTTAMLSVGFIWNTATSKWRCMAAV